MNGTGYPRELIRASAGTGKTFQISNRIIGLLAEGVEPGRILASTFTRKAAGEILDRVLYRLAEAALDSGKARELGEHVLLEERRDGGLEAGEALGLLHRLVRHMHRIDVGTLDALFVRMARSFSLELGLPPQWTIADDVVRERLRSEAVQAVLEEGEEEETVELLRMSAGGRTDRRVHDRLVEEVDSLHRYNLEIDPRAGDPWAPFEDRDTPDDVDAACHELAERLAGVEPPTNQDGSPDSRWESALAKDVSELRDGHWEQFWGTGPPSKFLGGERTYYSKLFPDGLVDLFKDIRDVAMADLAADYGREAEALGRIARRYHATLRQEQRRAGAYGFRDISQLLGGQEPLGGRDDLHHRLDRSSEHVLLDEFQDTSTPQWQALRPLVDRVAADDARDRSTVIVADPKQSIYGWRGADPEIVDRVGRLYDLESDSLQHSWRSSPVLLGFVNRLFGEIENNPIVQGLDEGPDVAAEWAEAFEEHHPAPPLEDRPGYVAVEVGPEDEGQGTDRPQLMARAADRVAAIHRDAPGAEVGVLVRRNKTVARLIHELRLRGVEASEEGGTSVDDAAPVAALLALLRLADHPGHTLARYQVAASPLGRAVGYADHLDDTGARTLGARVREGVLRDGYGPTLSRWVEELASSVNPSELRRLEQLVELGFRWEYRATLRPGDFVRFVENQTVEDPLSTPVRVMTVHKAKGLEFDVVVLPELDDSIERGKVETALPERDPETGLVRRIFPAVSSAFRALFPEMETALVQLRRGAIRDELSWLYVGTTRAKHALHFLVAPDDGASRAKSFARLVRAAIDRHGEAAPEGQVLFESGDPDWFRHVEGMRERVERSEPDEIDLRVDPDAPRSRILSQRSPSDLESDGRVAPGHLLRLDTPAAFRHGDVIHQWCQRIEWIADGLPREEELRSVARSVMPEMSVGEFDRLIERFRGWLEEPDVVDALSADATLDRLADRVGQIVELDLRRERPFVHRSHDEVVSGVIDRLTLARDANGQVLGAEILDFKSDRMGPDDQETLANRVDAYRPQVDAYRAAVGAMYGLDEAQVTARLVFLVPSVVREV